MTKKKPAGQNKSVGSKGGKKEREIQAKQTAKMERCTHARRLWHITTNRNQQEFWECKCGAFMGFK